MPRAIHIWINLEKMMQQRISGFWQGQLPVYRLKFLITLSLELISSNKRSCQIHVPLPDSKYIQFAFRARPEHISFRKNKNVKKNTENFLVKSKKRSFGLLRFASVYLGTKVK